MVHWTASWHTCTHFPVYLLASMLCICNDISLFLCRFIGIIIYMSFARLPSLDRYWSTNFMYAFNPVSKLMTKRRFMAILALLQVTPPADVDKGKHPLKDNVLSLYALHQKYCQALNISYWIQFISKVLKRHCMHQITICATRTVTYYSN